MSSDGIMSRIEGNVKRQPDSNAHFLPSDLNALDSTEDNQTILIALGGEDGYDSLKNAITSGKKIYIKGDTTIIPVSCHIDSYIYLTWIDPNRNVLVKANVYDLSGSTIEVIPIDNLKEYELPYRIIELTSESSSFDIGNAVGQQNGLQRIIDAAKAGRTFCIGTEAEGTRIKMSQYAIKYKDEGGEKTFGFLSYRVSFTITYKTGEGFSYTNNI